MKNSVKTSIVLGLFFGDEGKGLCTSYLAPNDRSLVIRFNGGHQAGHTVIKNGIRHVFSNFGSGTLNGAHTYWSEFCTFYPIAFCNERRALQKVGVTNPIFYVHPLAPVTTPWDIAFNRQAELSNKHGSVGVGFGTTVQRHTETPYKLYLQDLLHADIFNFKLQQVENYYRMRGMNTDPDPDFFQSYLAAVEEIRSSDYLRIVSINKIAHAYDHFVFEGAQGIMLDQDFGFFPHVTRSYTTSRNALEIMAQCNLSHPDIYYVMRSYLTRHGNGYLPGESKLSLKNNELETNVQHAWQGTFRTGYHSFRLLDYALTCDELQHKKQKCQRNFVVSCLDQTDGKILFSEGEIDLKTFGKYALAQGSEKLFYSENGYDLKEEKILNPADAGAAESGMDCINAV